VEVRQTVAKSCIVVSAHVACYSPERRRRLVCGMFICVDRQRRTQDALQLIMMRWH